jgi:hypothetical protein
MFLKFSQDIAKDVSFKDIGYFNNKEHFTQTLQKYIAVVKEIAISAE